MLTLSNLVSKVPINRVTGLANPISRSSSGMSESYVSIRQPFLKPVQCFSFNPAHTTAVSNRCSVSQRNQNVRTENFLPFWTQCEINQTVFTKMTPTNNNE